MAWFSISSGPTAQQVAQLITSNAAIAQAVAQLTQVVLSQGVKMSKALDDLTASVAKTTTVEQSALVLIQGFGAQLAAAGTDPAKLQALQSSLDTGADQLAAAVAANTAPATS